MKLLDAYVGKSVILATLVVIMVIVSLDTIFALVAETDDLHKDYQIGQALLYILMRLPRRIYEYMPMACLIGCLAGLGNLASSSELTVMRAAGISVARISAAVLKPTILFMVFSLVNAEYIVPNLERSAESMKTIARGGNELASNKGKGYWHKEQGEYVRFSAANPNGVLYGLSLYGFDQNQHLIRVRYAKTAHYEDGLWQLKNVKELQIFEEHTESVSYPTLAWQSELTPKSLTVVMSDPRDMSISDLYNYSSYLEKERLNSDKYMLSFWAKVNQPLGTIGLVLLGISFIFGPLRSVTPGFRIFSGIMVGLIYKYAEELLGPMSIILGFPPLLAILFPTLVCYGAGAMMMRKVG